MTSDAKFLGIGIVIVQIAPGRMVAGGGEILDG
jgi:hypothetical protein